MLGKDFTANETLKGSTLELLAQTMSTHLDAVWRRPLQKAVMSCTNLYSESEADYNQTVDKVTGCSSMPSSQLGCMYMRLGDVSK